MKSSNDKKDDFEHFKFKTSPSNHNMIAAQINQNIFKPKNQDNIVDSIFVTQAEPQQKDLKQNNAIKDNLIRKYNQIDSGQLVHVKSFSQQRSDQFIHQKRKRFQSYHRQPKEISILDNQDNSSIAQATTTTTTSNATKSKSKIKQYNTKIKEKMKTSSDLIEEHTNNFEWLIQLKTQQLQKNIHGMFLKNEKKKLLNSNSKGMNQIDENGEDLCISPSKSINNKIGLNKQSPQPKVNELDQIIQQEKFINQNIQRDVNQKQEMTNIQSPLANHDQSNEDKIILKLNQQANKLNMLNQNSNKQNNIRINKHQQQLTSHLSQIKKEIQAYNEDFCLPYLKPLRTFNNKTKTYLQNKQKGKKSVLRENSISSNNNESRISQYNHSSEVSPSPKHSMIRKAPDSKANLYSGDTPLSHFIKKDMLRYHLENQNMNYLNLDDDNLYSEHFKSPLGQQIYDPNYSEQDRYKLTFRKKSNTAQLGFIKSGEQSERKESISQTNNYQEQDSPERNKGQKLQSSIPNNILKAIRIKYKQPTLQSTEFKNIDESQEKLKLNDNNNQNNNSNFNNQIILPHLRVKSYHHNKISNNLNLENIDHTIQNQNNQDSLPTQTTQMQETTGDFFQLQSYYQKKYNNNDKMPKSFQNRRDIFSCQNSLSTNARQLQNANSLITDYELTDDPFKLQSNKRRSSSFFSSPQKQNKNKHILQNQNSIQLNNSNQIQQTAQTSKKKKKIPNLASDLQPWEDQQNFNETNFFQIVKERTDRSARQQLKNFETESSSDERKQ